MSRTEKLEKQNEYLFRLLINNPERKETGFAKEFLDNLKKLSYTNGSEEN